MEGATRLLVRSQNLAFYLLLVLGVSLLSSGAPVKRIDGRFIATAYSQSGITASGVYTQNHIVAADPDILPAGSVIKIRHAGRYSGEYVVADTGDKIVGHRLDIYVPSPRDCRKFGKRHVKVRVVSLGTGTHKDAKQSVETVKQDVQKDVSKGAVGNAANETDWTKQGAAVAAAVGATPPKKNSQPNSSASAARPQDHP